ncbi:MAG: hypothetical protein K8T20_09720 [Planctomycetes bacterium]|nr:hypothetical protein [Planctomycetota bacterium]
MFTRNFRTIASVALLLLSLPALAEEPRKNSGESGRSVHLKSGTVLEGRVIEVTDTSVVLEFAGAPGSRGSVDRSAVVPSDMFDVLVEARDPRTGEAWLDMANEAEHLGLYNNRIWSLRNAAKLLPDQAQALGIEIESSRQVCSKNRLALVREYLEAGELERARRYLKSIIEEYCGCVGEEEGTVLMKEITDDIERVKAKAKTTLAERRKVQDTNEDLQAVRTLMERGEDALRVGRESLERPGTAISHFVEAQALLERAWKMLAPFSTSPTIASGATVTSGPAGSAGSTAPPAPIDPVVTEVLRLKSSLRDDLVSVHVELGHAYLTRSDFVRATAHAGEASALDPEDSGVLALRIAIAAARSARGR